MSTESLVTFISCLIIAGASWLGVFSKKYRDTLMQRFALFGMCAASLGIAHYVYNFNDNPRPYSLFSFSVAVWSLSIVWKYRKGEK